MANYKRRKKKEPTEKQRTTVEKNVDDLLAFERFRNDIDPKLRQALLQNKPIKSMLKEFAPLAVARLITIALAEQDSGRAMSAIRDILDRSEGKAVETKKVEHSMSNIDDKDLDQLILSSIEDEALEAEFEEIDDDE